MFLLRNKEKIFQGVEDYYDKKVEIDFFIETRGEKVFFDYMELLKNFRVSCTYAHFLLLDQYNQKWNQFHYLYIGLLEDYFRAILYRGENLLFSIQDKYLPSLIEYILESKNEMQELISPEVDIKCLLEFRRKILAHRLTLGKKKQVYKENFMKILPDVLKENYLKKIKEWKEEYKELKTIVD